MTPTNIMTNIRYVQQLSNVQGEEENGGSDQGEEHEEVGELDDDDDGNDGHGVHLGAVHILRQPKLGVRRPPLPPRQQWSAYG